MKKWFEKHKVILIIFLILSVALFIMTYIQISYILQPEVIEDLNNYIKTNELTPSLTKYVIMTIINLVIIAIWSLIFTYIIWKIIFPTKKTAKDAFQGDSIKFLLDLPSQMKKELKRNE